MLALSCTEPLALAVCAEEGVSPSSAETSVSSPEVNLYAKLVEMGLSQKLVNIAVAQMRVPHDLVPDAAQEIRMAWLKARVKPEFSFGEVASYGHYIARHACLRARRDLGSPVRLPGSAFRRRKDGTASVTPGVLARPLDWNDIEERVRLEEEWCDDVEKLEELAMAEDADTWQAISEERESELKAALTPRQWLLLEALLAGKSVGGLSLELGIKPSTLTRQLSAMRARLKAAGLI
jgi:hypothetical protein